MSYMKMWLMMVYVVVAQGPVLAAPRTMTHARPEGLLRAENRIAGEYIVVLKETPEDRLPSMGPVAHELGNQYGVTVTRTYEHALRGFAIQGSEAQAQALASNPRVQFVQENGVVDAAGYDQPSPPWGLDRIDQRALPLDNRYRAEGAEGVNVYVIDSGILYGHSEFEGRALFARDVVGRLVNGERVFDGVDCTTDSHGTFVTGVIGGKTYGVARKATLWSVKVTPDCKTGAYLDDLVTGVDWVVGYGIRPAILNMSYASSLSYAALDTVVSGAVTTGQFVVVVAAGNGNTNACTYSPGRVPGAVTVAASSSSDTRWVEDKRASNYGPCVDLFAPGANISSALNTGEIGVSSGTSFAAPHVAGVAAVLLSRGIPAASIPDVLLTQTTQGALGGDLHNSPNRLLYKPSFIDAVVAGAGHSLALRGDGTVWAFGVNGSSQLGDGTTADRPEPVQVSGLGGVATVAAGAQHSLALRRDGTVWAWGSNAYGQLGDGTTTNRSTPVQVSGLSGVIAIAAGRDHSLAVRSDGSVWAWGSNRSGQLLGNTSTTRALTPVNVALLDGVTAVAAGREHSLAVRSDGSVWGWGSNRYGQLGTSIGYGSSTPIQPTQVVLSGVSEVSAGAYHSLAVRADSTVWAWGNNQDGVLGDGTYVSRWSPLPVNGLSAVRRVVAGGYHSMAVRNDGTAWAWGRNARGQLGDGTTTPRPSPIQVNGLSGVLAVGVGDSHSVAVLKNGTAWAWGERGRLGDGTTSRQLVPVQSAPLTSSVGLTGRYMQSFAVHADGTVGAWGYNASGQLGDGTTSTRPAPVLVSGLNGVTAVAAGPGHSLAVDGGGVVWAWGNNGLGELGDGTTTNRMTPGQVLGLSGVVAVAAGAYHSLALRGDGTVWAWGYNGHGELGDGTTTKRLTPVQVLGLSGVVAVTVGSMHSLAMRNDGTVWAWGYNAYGQLGDGTTTSRLVPLQVSGLGAGAVAMATGSYHSLAVYSDGSVQAWGRNDSGQLGDGTTINRLTPSPVNGLSGVTSLGAGDSHSLALRNDGAVWTWGSNESGQLGDGTTFNRPIPIQVIGLSGVLSLGAGDKHSLAMRGDGTVWAWGDNYLGQLGVSLLPYSTAPVQSTVPW